MIRTAEKKKNIRGGGLKAAVLSCLLAAGLTFSVPADEIVMEDSSGGTSEENEAQNPEETSAESLDNEEIADLVAPEDLFVDESEDEVSRKGESLDDARERDGWAGPDGGSTINIGHLYEINGVLVRNSDFPSEHYECWVYANAMYLKIWGHNFSNQFSDSENMLRYLPDEDLTLTPEHLQAYVSAAPAGAVLRICDSQYLHADDGWGHSQIIISHDENGFTVFEGGLSAFPHRREAYYTWSAYCYSGWPGKYEYIKYIKWPGAFAWYEDAAGSNAVDLGAVSDPEGGAQGETEMDAITPETETADRVPADGIQTETEKKPRPGNIKTDPALTKKAQDWLRNLNRILDEAIAHQAETERTKG